MRIAWFIHRYFPCVGGAENYGRAMVRRFVEAGHEVDVVTSDAHDLWYFTNKTRKRVDEPFESIVDGARVRRFPVRHRPLQRYVGRAMSYLPHWPTRCTVASYMPILPGIGRVRGDYDAVFAVGFPYTIFSYAAFLTARAAGAPLILTPFLHLATPGDKVNRAFTRPHQIRLLAESDTVVVQTGFEADQVRDWGIPDAKILKLGMAVEHAQVTGGDRDRFRTRLGIAADARVVGHLATLDLNKGTVDLVLALARLNASRQVDRAIPLILAGPSSPNFERFLVEQGADAWPWLKRTGPLAMEERADFFAAIDVFSMPSRTDSYGIVFLEAWANAIPVVAAAAGGVPDVVRHGEAGYLVPFGQPDQLARSIGQLIDDPATAHRLGDVGQRIVEHGHSWDDRFATLDGRMKSLVAGRPIPIPSHHLGQTSRSFVSR